MTGCSSVILLRPKMGVAPHKHDIISMPTQQCTNTKHISIERYNPVVSIMLRYLDQIKTFGENLCCRAVKIDKIFSAHSLKRFTLRLLKLSFSLYAPITSDECHARFHLNAASTAARNTEQVNITKKSCPW